LPRNVARVVRSEIPLDARHAIKPASRIGETSSMRSIFRSAVVCAAIAAATAASTPVWAQAEPQGPHAGDARFQAMREAHARQRAQDLRTILRLRPDQEPALTAFLQSRTPPGPPERHGAPPQALTTPQRLDEMAWREAEHAQARQRRTETVRTFYAALDAQQRQVFDALERTQHGGHGRGGPDGGGLGRGGWGRHGFDGGPPTG
jgi:Spy/CpxP family protein refolding chaperone